MKASKSTLDSLLFFIGLKKAHDPNLSTVQVQPPAPDLLSDTGYFRSLLTNAFPKHTHIRFAFPISYLSSQTNKAYLSTPPSCAVFSSPCPEGKGYPVDDMKEQLINSREAPLEQVYLTYESRWLAKRKLGFPGPLLPTSTFRVKF